MSPDRGEGSPEAGPTRPGRTAFDRGPAPDGRAAFDREPAAGRPGGLRIRAARPDEHRLIRELVQRAYGGYIATIGVRPPPMDADYPTAIARGRVFLGIDRGIAGVIVLCPQSDHLLIDNVAVDPSRQARGIGRLLLAFAEQRACTLGLPRVQLYTHERMGRNLRLYCHLGYERQLRPADDPRPRVLLTKELS